jgi:hypothetical protein
VVLLADFLVIASRILATQDRDRLPDSSLLSSDRLAHELLVRRDGFHRLGIDDTLVKEHEVILLTGVLRDRRDRTFPQDVLAAIVEPRPMQNSFQVRREGVGVKMATALPDQSSQFVLRGKRLCSFAVEFFGRESALTLLAEVKRLVDSQRVVGEVLRTMGVAVELEH